MYHTNSSAMGTTDIVAFYRQHDPRPDAGGRKLEDILSWDDQKLEYCHDYIQILFPLPELSRFNYNVPVIDEPVFETFNNNGGRVDLHKNLQRAFIRILAFYGFEIPDEEKIRPVAGQGHAGVKATWASNHKSRFANFVPSQHNHLRITRIIRSLRLLGRQDLAEIMFRAVQSVWDSPDYPACNRESMEWWLKAYNWPLYSPPQGVEGETGPGLEWLKQIIEAKSSGQVVSSKV